jgi:hypothetical protein
MQLYLEFLEKPDGFLGEHPNPWLALDEGAPKLEEPLFKTKLFQGKPTPPPALSNSKSVAFEVIKGTLNAFGLGITLGRTWNNDIAIADERVSRFHAFFQRKEGIWMVTDAGSRNGTLLHGERLTPRKAVPLGEKTILCFGGRTAYFYSPGGLVEYFRSA